MPTRVKVVFYSMYGHIHRMAEAVAEGARGVPGVEVSVHQVAELVPPETLEKSGAAGQETTITSFHTTLLHLGMVIVGVPYSEKRLLEMGEITGGTPYGASTIASGDGSRQPSDNELEIARFQGCHVAGIAQRLFGR